MFAELLEFCLSVELWFVNANVGAVNVKMSRFGGTGDVGCG